MVENIYVMSVKEYTHTNPLTEEQCTEMAYLSISKKSYKTLKAEGLPTKEYYQVIFAKEDFFNMDEIRQVLHKHVVYVDKACHTNY